MELVATLKLHAFTKTSLALNTYSKLHTPGKCVLQPSRVTGDKDIWNQTPSREARDWLRHWCTEIEFAPKPVTNETEWSKPHVPLLHFGHYYETKALKIKLRYLAVGTQIKSWLYCVYTTPPSLPTHRETFNTYARHDSPELHVMLPKLPRTLPMFNILANDVQPVHLWLRVCFVRTINTLGD